MRLLLLVGCCLLVVVGCSDGPLQPEVGPALPPDARSYVEGAALKSLDANGRFRLPEPAVDGPYVLIGAEQATQIALGLIRTWYANPSAFTLPGTSSLTESVEEGHGAPIDWQAVEAGSGGPYFAESHLEPLPEEFGAPGIRHFGPRFLVPLYVGATPVLVVSVAAYATNTSIDDRGHIVRTGSPTGGEFRVGIPRGLDGLTLPLAPEVAVQFAATQTGAKVVDVPALGTPGNRVSSIASRWHLVLDAAVEFERVADGQLVRTREVYVSALGSIADARIGYQGSPAALRLFVAAAGQPKTQTLGSVEAPLRPGYAVDLHEVRVRR